MEDQNRTPANEQQRDDRLQSEFGYVVGRITERDVVMDGQVVVPKGVQVTAAEAAAALAAGALENLAFAVGMGDPSRTGVQAVPDDVEGTMDPLPELQPDAGEALPATDTLSGTDQPTDNQGSTEP